MRHEINIGPELSHAIARFHCEKTDPIKTIIGTEKCPNSPRRCHPPELKPVDARCPHFTFPRFAPLGHFPGQLTHLR